MKFNVLKKTVGCILAGVIIMGTLGGCQTESGGTDTSGSAPDTQSNATTTAESGGSSAEAGSESAFEDVVDISVVLCSVGQKDGAQEVIDAVNAIAEKEAGVRISVEQIEIGNWVQQMNLKLSSSEPVDVIMCTPLMTFASMVTQNQLMDISGYLEEYGQGILEALPEEYIQTVTVDSGIYAVPMCMVKQDSVYCAMRMDTLDSLGLTEKAQNLTSWTELEEILQAVSENTTLVPLYCNTKANTGVTYQDYVDVSADDWAQAKGLDNLGDSYGLIYVDEETNTVCSYYQSDIFKADMERAADLYSKGYLYKDGATTDVEATDAFASDVCFASLMGTSDLGAETTAESRAQKDLLMVPMAPEVPTTHLINMWSYAVPFSAKEPEAAVRFINLLYTNADVVNLFTWGIEGRDYTLNEDGTATAIANAPYASQPWLHGNTLLAYPNSADGPDYQDQAREIIENQVYSPYLGFICDTSSVVNELTACNNAKQEYAYSLLAGSMPDYEQAYEDFMDKLEASGIDKIIACYQEQLNAWLAGN